MQVQICERNHQPGDELTVWQVPSLNLVKFLYLIWSFLYLLFLDEQASPTLVVLFWQIISFISWICCINWCCLRAPLHKPSVECIQQWEIYLFSEFNKSLKLLELFSHSMRYPPCIRNDGSTRLGVIGLARSCPSLVSLCPFWTKFEYS